MTIFLMILGKFFLRLIFLQLFARTLNIVLQILGENGKFVLKIKIKVEKREQK